MIFNPRSTIFGRNEANKSTQKKRDLIKCRFVFAVDNSARGHWLFSEKEITTVLSVGLNNKKKKLWEWLDENKSWKWN